MTETQSLKTMADTHMANKYRMVVESTSLDVIKTALALHPNAIIVETHHGLLLAVPVAPEK